jgi:SAM-dependent methyltransferase
MPALIEPKIPTIRGTMDAIISRGGPVPGEDPLIAALLQEAYEWALRSGDFDGCAALVRSWLSPVLGADSLQGLALKKPRGYAGDYEIIDRIYLHHLSPDPRLVRWDEYYHRQPAPCAVRNRKDYFHAILDRHHARLDRLRVLKIASGPGRGMFEWFTCHPQAEVTFDCVEIDAEAIAHASALNAPFLDRITFHHGNALRYRPRQSYDLIWAAGIFDYFADPVFVSLLSRLKPALARGGEIAIGNFSDANPSRPYMELLGDWHLHHRSAGQLEELALQAGFTAEQITIGEEPLGVNLFLHLSGGA